MTERSKSAATRTVEATDIVFRSRMTWALVVGGIMIGAWGGDKLSDVAAVGDSQAEILATVQKIQLSVEVVNDTVKEGESKRMELAQQILGLRDEVRRQDKERRLLQDFVEGRIGSMPYRPSEPNDRREP